MAVLVVVILLFAQNSFSFDLPRQGCNTNLTIDDNRYNLTNTFDVGDAMPLDINYDTYGNIFFIKSGRNEEGYFFDGFIIKGLNEPRRINGLPDKVGYSIAIDKSESKVYFGTGKGIYLYNYVTNSADLFMDSDENLNDLIIDKDGNKFIAENVNGIEELFLMDGKKKIPFHALQNFKDIAIDDHNNFFYIKEEKLFVLRSTKTKPVSLGNITYNGIAQISFHNHVVMIASQKLQYYLNGNDDDDGLIDLNSPKDVTGVAFDDSGNLALGAKGKIYKYEKTECLIRSK